MLLHALVFHAALASRADSLTLPHTPCAGLSPSFVRMLEKLPALPEVLVVLTVRHVPVPYVLPTERLLIKRLRFHGMFHVVSRCERNVWVVGGPLLRLALYVAVATTA